MRIGRSFQRQQAWLNEALAKLARRQAEAVGAIKAAREADIENGMSGAVREDARSVIRSGADEVIGMDKGGVIRGGAGSIDRVGLSGLSASADWPLPPGFSRWWAGAIGPFFFFLANAIGAAGFSRT